MSYQETLSYLYAQLPMFHRIGPAAYKPGLDTTYALLQQCGNPHEDMRCVHVAGTNGKGSTSHMIASALQEAGYKVGLYTSPHLKDFRERIKVNGQMIEEADVVNFVEKYKDQWQTLQPSFFEITVALAFWYFAKRGTDINMIEVGLGGRLDSTNVIIPEVSVITNIGYDHMNLLGDTIEKIAIEKAGIIKEKTRVVLGKMRAEAAETIHAIAAQKDAQIVDSALLKSDPCPICDLKGSYQLENRKTAFSALIELKRKGWQLSEDDIYNGLSNVIRNTGLMGRWQTLQTQPLCIADVAHNEDGITRVLLQIDSTPHMNLHIVIGLVADKEVTRVLQLLPAYATYYFCNASIPRAMSATELRQHGEVFHLLGNAYTSVQEAYEAAKQAANTDDMVLVCGSVFVVAEVL